jgi:hypothetical protein
MECAGCGREFSIQGYTQHIYTTRNPPCLSAFKEDLKIAQTTLQEEGSDDEDDQLDCNLERPQAEEGDDEERIHHEQQINDDEFDSNDEGSEEGDGPGDADDVDIANPLFQLHPLQVDETQQPTDEQAPVGDDLQATPDQGTTMSHPFEDQEWLMEEFPLTSAGAPSAEIDPSSTDRQSTENLYRPFTSKMDWEIAEWTKTYGIPSRALNALLAKDGVSLLSGGECS